MNSTSPEKNSERIRPEAYAVEMQASHDTELERALGKPRYSRDMEEENPEAEWLHRLDVGGIYDGFGFINHGDVARVKAGKMKREEMAAERVSAANSAETRIEKELERGSMEIADADLERVSNQFKIHLQPKKEYAAEVFAKLVECFGEDPELRALVPIFKASVAAESVRDDQGEPVPKLVLYTASYDDMQKAVDKLQHYFAGWEDKGSDEAPRFNWRINGLMHAAQSGADFKNALRKRDMLDAYYDENYNYAFRKGVGIYSREPIRVIRRSENFDELYAALDKLGGLVGSKRPYSSKELKAAIEGVRKDKLPLRALTESGGLYAKVEELLEKEDKKWKRPITRSRFS